MGEVCLYRPSNGSTGADFHDRWCAKCANDLDERCPILTATLIHNVDEPEYPRQWVQDEKGARCTAFIPVGTQPWSMGPIHDERQSEIIL